MSDLKNEKLSKAKAAIRGLQQQISDRLFKMAAEVEHLLGQMSPKDAANFLHAGCQIDIKDARSYVKISKTLQDSSATLRRARAQFPVLKALAAADDETRGEAIVRIEQGATLGAKDISSIRASFRKKKQTFAETSVRAGFAASARSAQRRTVLATKDVDNGVAAILRMLASYSNARSASEDRSDDHSTIKTAAAALLPIFVSVYGEHTAPLGNVFKFPNTREHAITLAYKALTALAEGKFGGEHGFALDSSNIEAQAATHLQECLQHVTSMIAPIMRDVILPERPPLTRLPFQILTVVELCAGAGGMSLGLESAGFHPLALYEFDKHAAATLRLNRPLWNVIEGDIRSVDFTVHRSQCVDLLVGGLPCQPYSIDGNGLGKDDPRDLLLESARAVREIRPRAFIFENVTGLFNARHADHLGNFLNQLKNSGYVVQVVRMEAEDYGVAQERSRMLFVGMKQASMAEFRAPPTFPEWRANLGDVLEDLMAANGWSGSKAWADARRNHVVVRNGITKRGALASTVVGRKGGSREKESARWAAKGIDIATVADTAPTPEQVARAGDAFLPQLTLRMRARLQGFPDWWEFVGGKDSSARQVGNAVPPVIGQAMGLAVRGALTQQRFDYRELLMRQLCSDERALAVTDGLETSTAPLRPRAVPVVNGSAPP